MKFKSSYGYFSDDGKEYIITTPITPRPWGNVISNSDYGMMISQTGSGYSWRGNAGQNRITRSFQDLIKDNWGKYFYIRDLKRNTYWSAAYKPVMHPYESFSVVHGIGYSRFIQKIEDIESELLVFVSANDPVEIFQLTLRNAGQESRELDVTSYAEWLLGFAPDEHREFHKLFIETSADVPNQTVYARKCLWGFPDDRGRHNNIDWPYTAFMSVSEPLKSFDCDKESFLGLYQNDDKPHAMSLPQLAGKSGRFTDAIAALQVEVHLAPGEAKTIVFTLGVAEDGREDAADLIERYTSVEKSKKALQEVHQFWSRFLDGEKVETPDEALNFMTNTWLKYQSISCRLWGKSAFYQVSAGYGFRDQLQDSQIFLVGEPEFTRKQLLMHAAQQFIEGDVFHWWFSIRGGGPRTNCSDDLLWLPFILDAYLQETDDLDILDESIPYLNGAPEPLYDHCKRAIERSFSRFSPRGIPLMGDHDWNDGLSAVGTLLKGESFWVAEFLYMILGNFIPLARLRGDDGFADKCQIVRDNLKDALNHYGWDGEWYMQATTDDGLLLGSITNDEGKIFLMPNTWAVISGAADEQRAAIVMNSVTKYLLRDFGTLLNYPAFTKPRPDIGYVTRYAPGLRENGGVYTHAATWAVWAYTLVGQPNLAYEAYRRICPPNRSGDIDTYKAEPYVTPGNIDGPLSEYYGRGGWTWYTGSSQWLHRVATHWILGIRPQKDGLLVDPSIPSDWSEYRVTRKFRNATYEISVHNPAHLHSGVKSMSVDGVMVQGNLIPIFADGLTHRVEVTMG
ncbi:MAG TPA: glycosyl transferase family 36 [Anaerolineaceae bacterium]|mgnify:FL=1|nr:glycosyl transferase family 36 [Anaerolineaceae bacterium]HQF45983.1 glycosyl transferase family 36 [Anaerolineaceae bacterium]HQH35706.1 glycosyl transferase family 36 [Anaerolineaceae bacterium]HQJ03966.1 glycosyl transferase family 36 [Anaerolineaceae bacterium]